jgi:hypothetical protein
MSMTDQILDTARTGRKLSNAYVLYRLNHSRRERNVVNVVHKCKFNDGTNSLICYPLRISNVDIGVEKPLDVVGTLYHLGAIEKWGHISMISVICEVDMTLTVDIGFTDLEDALAMWSRDGKMHRGRHWDIQPISGVLGMCYIFRDPAPLKPLSWRLERLSACEAWEEALYPNQNDKYLITQLRNIISILATANGLSPIPATHFPPGASLLTLADGPHVFQSFFIEPSLTQLDQSILDRMYFTIQATPEQWSFSSIHQARMGAFDRRGVYDRPKPPKDKEQSKASKRHEKERQKILDQPAPDLVNPATSREMTSRERGFARRYTRSAAKIKFNAWSSPRLKLPPLPEKPHGQSLVDEFISIWQWYEECAVIIQNVASATGIHSIPTIVQNLGTRVTQQSFLAADLSFAPGERFKKLFGSEYTEIMTKIVELRDTVPESTYLRSF